MRRSAAKPDKLRWEKNLQELAQEILKKLKVTRASVEVALLSDDTMHALERRYMNKEKKLVDVLSFPHLADFPYPKQGLKPLGEVYLNWELYRGNFEHLSFLLIHGILHVLGYDHEKRRDIIEMESLERRLHAAVMKERTATGRRRAR